MRRYWQFVPRTKAVASFLLLLTLVASGQSPSTPRYKESDILAILESAKSKKINLADVLKISGGTKFRHWDFDEKRCNENNSDTAVYCLRVGESHRLKVGISHTESEVWGLALQRACAFGDRQPTNFSGGPPSETACSDLGDFYRSSGDLDRALAVYLYAPGCKQRNEKCLLGEGSVYGLQGDRANELAVVQEECSQYSWPSACERVNELGGSADVAAARLAYDEQQQQKQADKQADREQQAADRAESQRRSDQRLNATLGAIQSLGGTNSIQDTANQQAAAIRATGDANAAKQRMATPQQVAQRQAAQPQTPQQNTSAINTAANNSSGVGSGSSGATLTNSSNAGNNANANTIGLTVSGGQYNNCVSTFYDPKTYNWLAFQNNCGQSLHVTWIFGTEVGLGSSADIYPGGSASTGYTRSEVSAKNGWEVYVCPAGYLSVDAQGSGIRGGKAQPYFCKPR